MNHRQLATRLQRTEATQQPELQDNGRVRRAGKRWAEYYWYAENGGRPGD
jgi:hypothetical protein